MTALPWQNETEGERLLRAAFGEAMEALSASGLDRAMILGFVDDDDEGGPGSLYARYGGYPGESDEDRWRTIAADLLISFVQVAKTHGMEALADRVIGSLSSGDEFTVSPSGAFIVGRRAPKRPTDHKAPGGQLRERGQRRRRKSR